MKYKNITEEQLIKTLKENRNDITAASKKLGVSRQWIYMLMNKYRYEIVKTVQKFSVDSSK